MAASGGRKVLNVGGGSKDIPLPSHYRSWQHVLLDIDPKGNPDIVCDARLLTSLPGGGFDAVYCSHNLEHYYRHDSPKVLCGFLHMLNEDGFAEIRVPDMNAVMRAAIDRKLDIDDVLYQSPRGPISVRDVIYGHSGEIEVSGNDFFAHKTGFTEKSLSKTLQAAGFGTAYTAVGNLEITAIAFKNKASRYAGEIFGLRASTA